MYRLVRRLPVTQLARFRARGEGALQTNYINRPYVSILRFLVLLGILACTWLVHGLDMSCTRGVWNWLAGCVSRAHRERLKQVATACSRHSLGGTARLASHSHAPPLCLMDCNVNVGPRFEDAAQGATCPSWRFLHEGHGEDIQLSVYLMVTINCMEILRNVAGSPCTAPNLGLKKLAGIANPKYAHWWFYTGSGWVAVGNCGGRNKIRPCLPYSLSGPIACRG